MKLTLGTNDIFDCPEGKYRAILETVGEPKKRIKKPCEKQVRLMYRVKTKSGKEHLVGRTFCADLSYGSELYTFLESWLNGKFDPFLDDGGQVDLNLLAGKRADLLIQHHDDPGFDKPFVKITAIFPEGTLDTE
jgi:hypothetical protein